MNEEIENDLENNDEVQDELVDDIETESDGESDVELDGSEDEYFEEIYSEILEAVNRNAEHLQLLQKSFDDLKFELFSMPKETWYRRFFKEIEMAIEAVELVEEELFELPD